MRQDAAGWTLERLVDFEQALAVPPPSSMVTRAAVRSAANGLQGAAARRAGLRAWLDESGGQTAGRRFTAALSGIAAGLASLLFVSGVVSTLGLLDRERGGINVTLFFAILIGGQWLILGLAGAAWLLRRKAAGGFSGVQALVGKLARQFAGLGESRWWAPLMEVGGVARAAVLWRLARLAQGAGIAFNLGILAGLAGLVLLKHVGFYWETTTDQAMRGVLADGVRLLAAPWAVWWPGAVPSGEVIDASRWLPGRVTGLAPGPAAWWEFLLAATFFWGLVPRAALWLLAWRAGRNALRQLDFQGRHHRALWRDLTGIDRVETDEKPLDGVLVLDVGGSGLTEAGLRSFLLRRLRVHPAAWESVAVLDEGAEQQAACALAAAPAGVVLLAEGWSLSPPRMIALHGKIRASAGADVLIKFLVANANGGDPAAPAEDERREWARFVDSLRDPAAEVYFYDAPPAGL
jgi:hypothetical protein